MTNIFTNAKMVEYNGKEVKSITTANSGVIWKKEKLIPTTTAIVTGSRIDLGANMVATGNILIDWGDGTTTIQNSGGAIKTHYYNDGLTEHTISFIGEITSFGNACFQDCNGLKNIIIPDSVRTLGMSCFYGCTGLTSIIIPNSVVSLGNFCFYECTGLTSVTIPSSVTSLEQRCFNMCPIVDYQLYWKDSAIIAYVASKMPNKANTVFTIPYGQTQNYINAGYPSNKLVERPLDIQI